jgi:hypothetical protein
LIIGRGIVEEVDKALCSVKTMSDDISILFDGQSSLSSVWFSDRLRELLKGGSVKAIRAGYHFEEEATVELVRRMDSSMSYLSSKVILQNVYRYVEELSLTRFAIHDFFCTPFGE